MPFAPSMVGTSVPSSFGTRRRVLRGTEAYVFRGVSLCPGARVLLGSVFCSVYHMLGFSRRSRSC